MPKKPEMKSEPEFRFSAQITNLCSSEWEDDVLFDEDDPDFAANGGGGGGVSVGVNGRPAGVLRPVVSQATAAAACVLNSLMLKGEQNKSHLFYFYDYYYYYFIDKSPHDVTTITSRPDSVWPMKTPRNAGAIRALL